MHWQSTSPILQQLRKQVPSLLVTSLEPEEWVTADRAGGKSNWQHHSGYNCRELFEKTVEDSQRGLRFRLLQDLQREGLEFELKVRCKSRVTFRQSQLKTASCRENRAAVSD